MRISADKCRRKAVGVEFGEFRDPTPLPHTFCISAKCKVSSQISNRVRCKPPAVEQLENQQIFGSMRVRRGTVAFHKYSLPFSRLILLTLVNQRFIFLAIVNQRFTFLTVVSQRLVFLKSWPHSSKTPLSFTILFLISSQQYLKL